MANKIELDKKATDYLKETLGGGQGGSKTRTLSLIGDVQCYTGNIRIVYESSDTTPSYFYNGEQESNSIEQHLLTELANGRKIHGYGYWTDADDNTLYPIELSNEQGSIIFTDLSGRNEFSGWISSLYGCDVIND